MNSKELSRLLQSLVDGQLSIADGVERLKQLPFEDLGVAQIDHHRELRQGVPEVVLGESKSLEQLKTILTAMAKHGSNILVTRLASEKAAALCDLFPDAEYDVDARTLCLVQQKIEINGQGKILVVCAGTSDIPVAREATVTARMLGNEVEECQRLLRSDALLAPVTRVRIRHVKLRQHRHLVVWSAAKIQTAPLVLRAQGIDDLRAKMRQVECPRHRQHTVSNNLGLHPP